MGRPWRTALDGLPDFHRLLSDGQATACFYAFDLLWLEAQDVRSLELIGRRRMLQKALRKAGEARARPCSAMLAQWGWKGSCPSASAAAASRARAGHG
jgi:ATP-dependent DNA ligase